jgi:DeoR/GlpR family transcriptional regulator of sugar metabolism
MLPIERRGEILQKLMMEGKVVVNELAEKYEVTEETIRRDLEKLESDGYAKKTYGGAVRNDNMTSELPYTVRKQTNVSGKRYIAEIIGSLISDGDSLLLDSSTTALFTVKSIESKHNLTLVTNSVEILLELAEKSDWTVFSTGGVLKEGALSLTGSSAERMIRGYHVDLAVCSCKGIDMKLGVSDSNEKDALIKQAVFDSAERRVLALDADKFDRKSFVKVCDLTDVDTIVTDGSPSEAWVEFLTANGVEVIY